jgi:hypothetical protein
LLFACGSPSGGDDDDVPVDAPITSTLDPAKCTPFAQSLATAAQTCGTPLPSGAQTTFEGFCKKGVMSASMCGGNPGAGLDCFASPDPNDWVCYLGEPYPACNGDLAAALGAYCLIALGNPQCASGIHCTYDVDCPNGSACNSDTGQCFAKTAYCVGLPCTYDVDCPDDEKCNSTEHACIHR